MKSYLLDLGDMEVLVHNSRGYELENGKIKDFFSPVPVLDGDIEISFKNEQVVEIIDETDAFKIYFKNFWGGTKTRDLLLKYFYDGYTLEEASEIIRRAYTNPTEEQIKNVKKIIKKQTGRDWK